MGETQILSVLMHGSPFAVLPLLFWLFMRERSERVAAQALVLSLTKDIVTATAQMVRVTEDNTKATNTLTEHVRALGDRVNDIVVRRRSS